MSRIVGIIEARMASSRLPGKVLLEVMGKPMLLYIVESLRSINYIDEIVIATTTNKLDDEIQKFADRKAIKCFRGSESDVMLRVLEAATKHKADIIVEVTGDCPLIDPEIVEQCIITYKNNNVDYVNNVTYRSYPDGMDVQVFNIDALRKSESMTHNALDREHVTLHIRNNPNLFKAINLIAPISMRWPELGITLDEEGDFMLIKEIIELNEGLTINSSCSDIIKLLRANPKMLDYNKNVKRKGDT